MIRPARPHDAAGVSGPVAEADEPPSGLRTGAIPATVSGACGILLGLACLLAAAQARAQSVVDGSEARIAPGITRALLAEAGQALRGADPKVTGLRMGRNGAICGAVEVRNRMGTYTGPRPFVFEPATQFFGRLPEVPELRSPASPAAYAAMERARLLFAQNCTGDESRSRSARDRA